MFNYGELVKINNINSGEARVKGKIKDADCYVIVFHKYYENPNTIIHLGFPNRNLPLEWGNWKGYPSEFVVPATIMSKI